MNIEVKGGSFEGIREFADDRLQIPGGSAGDFGRMERGNREYTIVEEKGPDEGSTNKTNMLRAS